MRCSRFHAFSAFNAEQKPQDLSLTVSKIGPVRLPPIGHLHHFVHHDLLLMVQKSGIHQLRLVVFAIIHKVFYITGGCLGFLNHQQYHICIHCHLCIASLETPNPFHGPNHVFVGNLRVSRHAHLTSVRLSPRISISVMPISGGTAT